MTLERLRGLPLLTPEGRNALVRADFATFVQVMFPEVSPGVSLRWAAYLDLVCAYLADVAHGRRRNLIITMPPRHLKSFCVSVALPAYVLGLYPDQEVMCVSYGQDLARKFAEDGLTIMRSAPFLAAFGDVLPRRRQSAQLIRTIQGGVRRATSLDGTATGVGGDLIIFDDPQKPGETLSDAVRRSTNEAFEQTFLSRRNDPSTARMVVVMQRLHEDDFVNHVRELGDWELINLPAIAEQDEEIAYATVLGNHRFSRREGEALHPTRVPLSELALIRTAVGEAVWATQYQQRPAPAGGGFVKIDWFRRYTPGDLPDHFDRTIQSWDTANKLEEWNDYSVCTTWGVEGKRAYLLHVFRARLEYPDLRRAVLEQARLHGADVVYIEDRASGTQLLQDLRADNFGSCRPVKPTADKRTRMVNQTAPIENQLVYIPAEAPWLAEFLHELAVFPNGKFDDQVDSVSQALEAIYNQFPHQGLYDFYRLQAEKLTCDETEIWIVKGPPTTGQVIDAEGGCHYPEPDGCYHLPRRHAWPLLRTMGWELIR
jgi:predicted phage terminase large subunit-like protein